MPTFHTVVTALAVFAAMLCGPAGAAAADAPQGLWTRGGQPTSQADELRSILRRVGEFGLDEADFAALQSALDAASEDPFDARLFENAMSSAALRLMTYLHDGRVDPQAAGYELSRRRAPLEPASMLKALASSRDQSATLAALEPGASQYRLLKKTLARYRGIPDRFTPLSPPGASVRPGDAYPGAPALRRRLEELGDLAPADSGRANPEVVYDADLSAAVAQFQHRHGLLPDGVLGPRTLTALAVPMSRRIRQIELTLERWRWLPQLRAPAVIVNVPQFMLYALPDPAEPGAAMLEIPVIVGKEEKQTPVFDSRIEAVVIRPYWEVPRSIVEEELLPQIERNAGYLARHDLEIVRGGGDELRVLPPDAAAIAELRAGRARLRQRPGEQNALGRINLVLPNRHDVYLQSTPEGRLFAREQRALSHGCIRVSDSIALAAYLLKHTPGNWSADAIEAATCGQATFTVKLATPVPVYILYGTVVMDSHGDALFFDDIYGYDRKLEALLSGTGAALALQRQAHFEGPTRGQVPRGRRQGATAP
jgi:murein L,D-transpeptidase YcbB/YkuD